jgi:predicted component of type VI protein secretion system
MMRKQLEALKEQAGDNAQLKEAIDKLLEQIEGE